MSGTRILFWENSHVFFKFRMYSISTPAMPRTLFQITLWWPSCDHLSRPWLSRYYLRVYWDVWCAIVCSVIASRGWWMIVLDWLPEGHRAWVSRRSDQRVLALYRLFNIRNVTVIASVRPCVSATGISCSSEICYDDRTRPKLDELSWSAWQCWPEWTRSASWWCLRGMLCLIVLGD